MSRGKDTPDPNLPLSEAADPPQRKRGYEKRLSLHPLTPEDALRRAMSVPPPKKGERSAGKKR